MRSRIYSFESEDIIVHWDYVRCIHVEACIRTLPAVFDRHRRPWIDPSLATAEDVVRACEACPTGALHYERKDGGSAEATPDHNTITLSPDGPLFAKGDLKVRDASNELVLEDTRAAICRCGHSRNKPLCDGSHREVEFLASGTLTSEAMDRDDGDSPEGGALEVRASDPGPLMVRGSVQIVSNENSDCAHVRVGALCCCGKSKNKPFCDGSHALP